MIVCVHSILNSGGDTPEISFIDTEKLRGAGHALLAQALETHKHVSVHFEREKVSTYTRYANVLDIDVLEDCCTFSEVTLENAEVFLPCTVEKLTTVWLN